MSCQDCETSDRIIGPTKTSRTIDSLISEGVIFPESTLFTPHPDSLTRDLNNPRKLLIDSASLVSLYDNASDNISISLPSHTGEILKLFLIKVQLYTDDFKYTDGLNTLDVPLAIHYFGVIDGKLDSRVIVNIFHDQVTCILHYDHDTVEIITDKTVRDLNEYTMVVSSESPDRPKFTCQTDTSSYTESAMNLVRTRAPLTKSLRLHMDSIGSTLVDTTSIFSAVKEIYINDPDVELNILGAEIGLWTLATLPAGMVYDPAAGSGVNLDNYTKYRFNNQTPNTDAYSLTVVKTTERSLSGVAFIRNLCHFSERGGPVSLVLIEPGITPKYPTASWNAGAVAHELGHNIGSLHTFDCVWNGPGGPNQSLGGCSIADPNPNNCVSCTNSNPLGTCTQPGSKGYLYTSANGATGWSGLTLMGYCDGGTDYKMVFGPQPGTVIRNAIIAAGCLLCVDRNTLILLPDGSYKPIYQLKRGDYVAADLDLKKSYRISRVTISSHTRDKKMAVSVFEPNAFGEDKPFQKLTITGGHPIFYEGKRCLAWCFKKISTYYEDIEGDKIFALSEQGVVDVYDLQFDEPGSYVANGVKVQSRSPWSSATPLPKELYYDVSKYREEKGDDIYTHEEPLHTTDL
jgi:hypothetical protein